MSAVPFIYLDYHLTPSWHLECWEQLQLILSTNYLMIFYCHFFKSLGAHYISVIFNPLLKSDIFTYEVDSYSRQFCSLYYTDYRASTSVPPILPISR